MPVTYQSATSESPIPAITDMWIVSGFSKTFGLWKVVNPAYFADCGVLEARHFDSQGRDCVIAVSDVIEPWGYVVLRDDRSRAEDDQSAVWMCGYDRADALAIYRRELDKFLDKGGKQSRKAAKPAECSREVGLAGLVPEGHVLLDAVDFGESMFTGKRFVFPTLDGITMMPDERDNVQYHGRANGRPVYSMVETDVAALRLSRSQARAEADSVALKGAADGGEASAPAAV